MISFRVARVLVVALLAHSVVWAQPPSTPVSADQQFAQFEQMLSGVADDLLAQSAQPAPQPHTATVPVRGPARLPSTQAPGKLRAALGRVRDLRPIIEPILRQEGIPPELTAVVLVESGGQPMAISSKGARGLWQLMPDTARRYGLVVTADQDERLDVVKSTHAAARYLRDLYTQFGHWELALAAYNAGEQLVHSMLQRSGGVGYQALSRGRRLPDETRSYVPAVLAAMRWLGEPSRPTSQSPGPPRVLFASLGYGEQ